MIRRLQQLHADEGGFTLIELLVAMIIGLAVLMGAFALIDHASSASRAISDRQDAAQRGRTAMEYITTALRSQVCLGENTEPITAGNQNGVTFYANLSANPDAAQQRTLSYNPTTKDIVDEVRDGAGTYPDLTFPVKATKTVRVLSSAVPMVENTTTQPMFRFYTYKAGTSTGELTQLGVPLNSETAPQVVMVKVAFFARPETLKVNDHMATSLQSDIYVRLADPTRPAEGPRCL